MKIGFIGLGMMGSGMAANLQKAGHDLVVHDLRRVAAEPYVAAGAVWADSPRAVAEAAEVVFTSLPGPPEPRCLRSALRQGLNLWLYGKPFVKAPAAAAGPSTG